MSILIKGMEMPTNCGDYPCARIFNGYTCTVAKRSFDKYPLENRMDWCPLVPVPPHGRLIDADALYRTIDATSERTIGHTTFKETVLLDIRGMPTILESTIGQLNSDPAVIEAEVIAKMRQLA